MAMVDETIQPPRTTTITTLNSDERHERTTNKSKYYKLLLGVNYAFLMVGSISSTVLSKLYFTHGGSSRWVSAWLQCGGFPLLVPAVFLPYHAFRCTQRRPFAGFSRRTVAVSGGVGLMLGANNLLISWGTSYLPVSTCSLVLSSQLLFVLVLSAVVARQRITFANLNCVVILTLAAVLLALDSGRDRPKGLTTAHYFVGFFCVLGAALLFAIYLPLVEMIYRKVYCYGMVVEMQLVMEVAASVLATAGMIIDGGFSDMRNESEGGFELGSKAYAMTLGFNVVTWQLCFMGTAGMVFLTTSLTSGICSTALMALNVIAGVFVFGDHFGACKAVSALLSLWAFSSYVYGMYLNNKNNQQNVNHDHHGP